ncbi:MAG: alpha-L-arabinofuranosidase domain protein [Phycisphaerales bacterium]|nr:alpha-L-arabinofuranosidase domain protein [Phycisphaerales bacterium]
MKCFKRTAAAMIALASTVALAAEPAKLTVHADQPAAKIGPLWYGLMTEELNHSYDGGLYAELVRNRIFQDGDKPIAWDVVTAGGGAGTIEIDTAKPVNGHALTRSLRLDITTPGERVGAANAGFWGVPAYANTTYKASFYARVDPAFTGPLTVSLEKNDGTALATAKVESVGAEWKKYEVELKTGDVAQSTDNRLVISAASKGSVWLSLVSLFPPTYNNQPNGFRPDLLQKLIDLKPKFLRFPGGNYLEGDTVETRFKWKETLGALEDRPGHMGCWGYRSSDGLGLLEFLNWCEAMKAEPILAVYAGYSLRQVHVAPGPDLEPFVKEALEEIEYCQGDASTEWGARRIKDGHPAPFPIKYVEIGNEDWFDKSKTYEQRFAQVYDAIKAKYPNIQCISTMPVTSRKADLQDDHDYPNPRAMLKKVDHYKNYDPTKPKIFFGEWATRDGSLTPSLRCALADAAWMTGLQRDAETVLMNCYAPLLTRVEKQATQWPTDLIGYDSATSFGSVSYYAQKMFNENLGDVNLASDLVSPPPVALPSAPPHGAIGVGTWSTAAEFKDMSVTHGEKPLLAVQLEDAIPKSLKPTGPGKWSVEKGVLTQSDTAAHGTRIEAGDPAWTDYTLRLKARKTAGDEGFLVYFHSQGRNTFRMFNVGGWDNTRTGLERIDDNEKAEFAKSVPKKINDGQWYDLRVEVAGTDVKCYVDDKLILSGTDGPPPPIQTLYTAASRETATGDIILKAVNYAPEPQPISFAIDGAAIGSQAVVTELAGTEMAAMNSIADPMKIAPKESKVDGVQKQFDRTLPPQSFTIVRLKAVK